MKRTKIAVVLLASALTMSYPASVFASEPSTETESYEELSQKLETLQAEYDELSKKYEEALKTIESLQETEALPEYDISGTVNDVSDSTFTVTTSKGNVYTFTLEDYEINIGETISFKYTGEISGSNEIQDGKVSDLVVTAQAPAGAEYETGITYSDLSRTPDDFEGKKVKFSGKVIQLIEDTSSDDIQIRFAVDGDYDEILFGEYDKSIVTSRVLEDDWITIYGISAGLISYQSTLGGTITIPAAWIESIDQ